MLIRRFGILWTLVPNLDFSHDAFPELIEDWGHRFHNFVRSVLLLHQAPTIHSFRLETNDYVPGRTLESVVDEIYTWIKCAIGKQPKIVSIHIPDSVDFHLPQCIFISQSIVKLSLNGFQLKHQKIVHMGSLRSLRLQCVTIERNEILRDMVSGFPSLETLEIYDSCVYDITLPSESIQKMVFEDITNENCHSFYCPKVKVLDISCYWGGIIIDESDLSSVCEASIRFSGRSDLIDIPPDETTKVLEKLENAEILTFEGLLLEGATIPQNRWKVLTLTKPDDSKPCIPWISYLLGNSSHLEELTIDAGDEYECTCPCVDEESDSICPKIYSPFVAHHLRKVHINSKNEDDHEFLLQLVEIFLKHGIVLVELVISCVWPERLASRKRCHLSERHMSRKRRYLSERISRFTRASTNITIVVFIT